MSIDTEHTFDFKLEIERLHKGLERVREPQPLRRSFADQLRTGSAQPVSPLILPVANMRCAVGRMWEITDIGVYSADATSVNGHTAPPASTSGVNQIVLGANGVAAFNNNNFPVQQTVSGGTVTAIAINGVTTGLTSGTFTIPALGSITVTYSVAPTTFSTAATAQIIADMYAGASAGLDNPGDMSAFIQSSTIPTATPLIGDKKAYATANDQIYAWIYNAAPNSVYAIAGVILDWRIIDRSEMMI